MRAKKEKLACQSNLKDIALSTMLYVRDWDETFMPASNWKGALTPYKKFGSPPTSPLRYVCSTNERAYAFHAGLSGARLSLITDHKTMALFYEPSHSVNADAGQSWASEGVHGEGSNVCFLDGHVDWVKAKPTFWTGELASKAAIKRRHVKESP